MEIRLEPVPCSLCGAEDDKLLFEKESLRIVKCCQCGLVFVNPRLAAMDVVSQYDETYYSSGSYRNYLSERAGFEKTFDNRLKKIERLVNPGRILDVGCAFGFFLCVAQKRGWEAYGVDVSPVGCRYATEELGLRAICASLAESGFAPGFFDVVIMNDTFEHLADPSGDLQRMRELLRPGGYLFLVTQDSGRLLVRLLGQRWAQYKPREHLYYFTAATLRRMLAKTGYRVLKIGDEGLVCTLDFLVDKLSRLWKPAGMAATSVTRRLGIGQWLVPMRTGYEVMVYAQKAH